MKQPTGLLYSACLIGLMISAPPQQDTSPQQPPATPTPTPAPGNEAPRVKFIDLQDLNKQAAATTSTGLVMIEGAAYLVFGDTVVPLPGGGASGCLDKDAGATAARLARARAAYAQRLKKD